MVCSFCCQEAIRLYKMTPRTEETLTVKSAVALPTRSCPHPKLRSDSAPYSGNAVSNRVGDAAVFAGVNALIEESALHGVARQSDGVSEVLARNLAPPAAKFKLA